MGNEQPYESVSSRYDHEESRSSTEVGSIIGDAEKQWHEPNLETGKPTRLGRALLFGRRYRWAIDTFLILFNIGLSLILIGDMWKPSFTTHATMQVGGDFMGAGPKFSTKVIKWNAEMSFVPKAAADWFTPDIVTKWNTIMPVGTTFPSGEETFSTTSMTHSLHCLFMMGRIYAAVTDNTTTHHLPNDYHSHMYHCIDYLRQSIMCAGDMSVEPHNPTDSEDLGPDDGGWKGMHVCKDYSEVIKYLEAQIRDGVRTVLPIDD